jgi:hypothetical protein
MQPIGEASELAGRITEACANDVLAFAREVSVGEGRRAYPIISARYPREQHSSDLGIAFGLYGDFPDRIERVFLARTDAGEFCIALPLAEKQSIANGIFWLHQGEFDTIYLTDITSANVEHQGRCNLFRATWIEQMG